MPEYQIQVDRLRPGVFIRLDVPWFDHPFLFREFKIRKEEQIEALKEMGITTVFCVPEKSDMPPKILPRGFAPPPEEEAKPARPAGEKPVTDAMWLIKRERVERLKAQKAKLQARDKEYSQTMDRVQKVYSGFDASPEAMAVEGRGLVDEMVTSFLSDKEVFVHLMSVQVGSEDPLYHSLSTAVLGIILGKQCGLNAEMLQKLGLGLLFHDIGKRYRSQKVLYKQNLLQLHPVYGEEMMSAAGGFPRESVDIVRHHHERIDGKGFPDRWTGDRLNLPVKIACIVNGYDNFCNRPDPKASLTPNQALSHMFARERNRFDLQVLSLFIHALGVYPPGTVVQLSNGNIGMIASVSSKNPLRPNLLLYDREIPKEEALLFDMSDEPDLSIVKSLHPRDLEKEVFDYLHPQGRLAYFVGATNPGEDH
jgi:HD-GYP domain-containing protein (c-di-GMP phosphodiesterase class II)